MKRIFLSLFTLFLLTSMTTAQSGYQIDVKIDGHTEKEAYFGYHYGDKQYIKDTVQINSDGYFTFKGDEALEGGVYLIIMPPENQYFEFLIDGADQHFTLETTKENAAEKMQVKDSKDNETWYGYLRYLSEKIPMQKKLHEQKAKLVKGDAKMGKVEKELDDLNKEVKKYHNDLINKSPKSLPAALIRPRLEIDLPEFEGDEKEQQMKRYYFYKKHYFDNIDLGDDRLLRSPFLFKRVDYYMNKLTPQHPDSISISIDYLLGKMEPAEETFKYYLIHFLNKYASSKVVGQDAVYVHLVDKYYKTGKAPWTEEEQLAKIIDNADRLKPVLIGVKARNIKTQDKDGQFHDLYKIDSKYTIVYFWAPDCGHCKKMTPFLIDFNEKFSSKGVKIMTICKPKSGEYKECWDYIDEKENMNKILNTFDPSNRAQIYYNIRSTPSMFILDKDKKIIMKGIGADQLEEVMDEIILRDQKMQNKKP